MNEIARTATTLVDRPGATAATRDVVDAFLFRLGIGDFEGASRLFAGDFEWHLSWPADQLGGPVPWIRERRTAGDVASHFATIAEHNTSLDPGTSVDTIVVDGIDAVILGTIRNMLRRSGRAYEARFALHLTVEHGLIQRYSIHEDSLAVALAWFG